MNNMDGGRHNWQDQAMLRKRWLPVILLTMIVAACTSDSNEEPGETETPALTPGATVTVDLDDRPFQLHVPESYDPAANAPLVVVLHGYTASGAEVEDYFHLTAESDRRGFLYAMPDGTMDADGEQFWNAFETCCDFQGSGTDDSGYLRRVIDTVIESYPVDASRVYLIGHSNGGFMAHRMACDHAGVITAIVSFAGAATSEPSQCAPERPVSVLQIHGTGDTVIPYDGGAIRGRPFPSVADTLALWRGLNGCTDQAGPESSMDLDSGLPGAETTMSAYTTGCREGSSVALWSIADGSHVPALTADVTPAIMDFLYER